MIISPNVDPAVIAETKRLGLWSLPGVNTPTEAFRGVGAGADALKLFPAEAMPPPVVKALTAVLPKEIPLLPVGGIGIDNMAAYLSAGAVGFGIGSSLYKPGKPLADVARDAAAFIRVISGQRD
jgi:2-dehydro-3-deoxyphosphogalactonate aldolase